MDGVSVTSGHGADLPDQIPRRSTTGPTSARRTAKPRPCGSVLGRGVAGRVHEHFYALVALVGENGGSGLKKKIRNLIMAALVGATVAHGDHDPLDVGQTHSGEIKGFERQLQMFGTLFIDNGICPFEHEDVKAWMDEAVDKSILRPADTSPWYLRVFVAFNGPSPVDKTSIIWVVHADFACRDWGNEGLSLPHEVRFNGGHEEHVQRHIKDAVQEVTRSGVDKFLKANFRQEPMDTLTCLTPLLPSMIEIAKLEIRLGLFDAEDLPALP